MLIIRKQLQPYYLFALLSSLVVTVCVSLLRSEQFLLNPTLAAAGVTFDLTVTVTLLYYLLVVRAGRASVATLIPVLLAGLSSAHLLLPAGAQGILHPLRFAAVPLELFAAGWAVYRVKRYLAAQKNSGQETNGPSDPLLRFEQGLRGLYGDTLLVNLVLAEVSVFYFAFLARFFPQPLPEGAVVITDNRKRGWGMIVAVMSFLILVEGGAAHFALQQWSPIAAWVWTAFDVYALILVFADYQALRTRPSFLTNDGLHIRFGLRWSAVVPISRVDSMTPLSWKGTADGAPDYLKLTLLSDPEFIITLREPVEFRGPLGIRKRVRRIGISFDDPQIASRLSEMAARDAVPVANGSPD